MTKQEIKKTKDINNILIQSNNNNIIIEEEFKLIILYSIITV